MNPDQIKRLETLKRQLSEREDAICHPENVRRAAKLPGETVDAWRARMKRGEAVLIERFKWSQDKPQLYGRCANLDGYRAQASCLAERYETEITWEMV